MHYAKVRHEILYMEIFILLYKAIWHWKKAFYEKALSQEQRAETLSRLIKCIVWGHCLPTECPWPHVPCLLAPFGWAVWIGEGPWPLAGDTGRDAHGSGRGCGRTPWLQCQLYWRRSAPSAEGSVSFLYTHCSSVPLALTSSLFFWTVLFCYCLLNPLSFNSWSNFSVLSVLTIPLFL